MNNNSIRRLVFASKSKLLPCFTGEIAQKAIYKDLINEKPSMIARFGAVEIKALLYATLPPQLTFV